MRLRQIEVFYAVYCNGSVTKAANQLHVSQPSISKVLAHTEQQLGFALFERQKGKLIPTAEAHLLFSDVEKVYQQLLVVNNRVHNIQSSQSGVIDIAVSPALGFSLIPKAIASFRNNRPDVQFRVQTLHNEQAQQSLLAHKCDIAILFDTPPLAGVTQQALGESQMVLLTPNDKFAKYQQHLPVSELHQQEIIGIWDSGPLGDKVWQHLIAHNVNVSSRFMVDTYFIAARLVDAGVGMCAIDQLTAEANITRNTRILMLDPPLHFNVKALCLETKPISKLGQDFLQVVKELL